MRISEMFMPTLREIPSEAEIEKPQAYAQSRSYQKACFRNLFISADGTAVVQKN